MLGQTNLLSNPSDSINRFVPKYPYDVGLALIANAAKHTLLKKLLTFDDFDYQSIEALNQVFASLINTVWCDHSGAGGPRVAYTARSWVDKSIPLKSSYAQVVHKVYKDVVNQIDYSTKDVRTEVNYWASKVTAGLITGLVPESCSQLIDQTTLVFSSTLYFKDIWNVTFDPHQTKSQDFYTLDGRSVRVPFMTRKNKVHHLLQVDSGVSEPFSVLSLPYRQGQGTNFTMLMVLPKARDGLPNLLHEIFRNEYKFLKRYYPHRKVEVDNLLIPRVKVSGGDTDPNLGFLPACPHYDLTGMVDSPVGQKFNASFNFFRCFIEVNEEGTTVAGAVAHFVKQVSNGSAPSVQNTKSTPAAAANRFGSGSGSDSDSGSISLATSNNGKFNFVADHPFALFIVETKHKVTEHNHDVVGFQGFVLNPLIRY